MDFSFKHRCGLCLVLKFLLSLGTIFSMSLQFLQASSAISYPFFSLVKTYQSKPSLCCVFACNPCSACYYYTLHLTIQYWGFLTALGRSSSVVACWGYLLQRLVTTAHCCFSARSCKTVQVYLYRVSSAVSRRRRRPRT